MGIQAFVLLYNKVEPSFIENVKPLRYESINFFTAYKAQRFILLILKYRVLSNSLIGYVSFKEFKIIYHYDHVEFLLKLIWFIAFFCKESTGLNNGEQVDVIIVGQYFL